MLQEIIQKLSAAPTQAKREQEIGRFLEIGTLPNFIFEPTVITVTDKINILEYKVCSEYLCLGTEQEYMHIPMSPLTCKEFMLQRDFVLPTPTMSKQIYSASKIKPGVISWSDLYKNKTKKYNRDSTMCYVDHSNRLQEIIKVKGSKSGELIGGHKKDVVLTNMLTNQKYKNNVAIYGWFNTDGSMIQNLNAVDHVVTYVDYSHGLRMVYNKCKLNGQDATIKQIWNDTNLCKLLHDDVLKFQSY
jgi:hypothetical protein